MTSLAYGVVIANSLDTITFLMAFNRYGLVAELNPVVIWIVASLGLGALLLLKAGSTALTLLTRNRYVYLLGTVVGLFGAATNLLSL